jgi:hypothetical protein
VPSERRERIADWLIVGGAVLLVVSLFLTWSHQFSARFLAQWGSSDALRGVPHDPTAWQVYSAADVLLALLAAALVAVAIAGRHLARLVAVIAGAAAVAFVVHAMAHPPTNGANIFDPDLTVPALASNSPAAGPGETVALLALVLALVGLVLSLTVPQRRAAPS